MDGDRRTFMKQAGGGHRRGDRQFATAKRAMVSTSRQYATEAGLAALRRGGNVVDACLTAALAQTVVEPETTTLAPGPVERARGLNHEDDR